MMVPVLSSKGKVKFKSHSSQNVAFLAEAGSLAVIQADVQVDRLQVQAHQQLPEPVQCRLDETWQKWLLHTPEDKLRCHKSSFFVAELAGGLFDEVLPVLCELQEACWQAGGR
jgi:hypothetical protein